MIQDGLDHEAVVKTVVGLWEDWDLARAEKLKIWQECIGNYLVTIDETKYADWPWRCKVADTFSQETADTIAAAIRNALFPQNEDYFEVRGEDDLGRQHAPVFFEFLQRQLHRSRFIGRLGPWIKQLVILGNAPLLLDWSTLTQRRKRRVRRVNVITGEPSIVVRDEQATRYDGPIVTTLDLFDVVFDPTAMRFEQTPMIRRSLVPRDRLATLYKGVDFSALTETPAAATSAPTQQTDQLRVARAKLFGVETATVEERPAEQVEILELHGTVVIDGERHEDVVIAIVDRRVLARFETNPYWGGRQLLIGTYDDVWFSLFGKGALEPVRGIQNLIDTFQNQKADILNLIINGCFAYVDDGIIDPAQLVLRPRGGIEVGNLANIKELHPNQNVALTYQEIDTLRARGERSTGASRFDMGQAPGGRRTAFEASMIGRGASGRSLDVTKHLANDVLEYVLEWFLVSNQQFLWDTGQLSNDVLLGQYRINYLGADLTAMRQFETQQLLLFMDLVGRYKPIGEAIELRELAVEIVRMFHFKNPNIAKDKEKYEQEEAQRQAQAAAEAQANAQPPAGARPPGPPGEITDAQAAQLGGLL